MGSLRFFCCAHCFHCSSILYAQCVNGVLDCNQIVGRQLNINNRLFGFYGFFYHRNIHVGSVVRTAVSTNFVCACAVTSNIGVANSSNSTKFYRYFYADVLAYCKYALAVLYAVTSRFACCNCRLCATFGNCSTCFCKRYNCHRYTYGGKLVSYSRTSLIFNNHIGHFQNS